MDGGGKKGSKGGHGKGDQGVRKDRRSATGVNGEPKKGGHGGKFTWAGDQRYADEELMAKGALDAKDPNFEEAEAEAEEVAEVHQGSVA